MDGEVYPKDLSISILIIISRRPMRLLSLQSRKIRNLSAFQKEYASNFDGMLQRYQKHNIFKDVEDDQIVRTFTAVIHCILYLRLFCLDYRSELHRTNAPCLHFFCTECQLCRHF